METRVEPWVRDWLAAKPQRLQHHQLVWWRNQPCALWPLLLGYPPNCVVRGSVLPRLLRQASDCGVVRAYVPGGLFRHWPAGCLLVGSPMLPETAVAKCRPNDVRVVGYHGGLVPAVVACILRGDRSTLSS